MDRLRDPGGCPWDREQTLDSLASFLIEEAYEVVEAVRLGQGSKLSEELGDLLLQIIFMARIGRERGWFDLDDVCGGISEKMVRRHPHVFSNRAVSDADEVVRNWEDIKQAERAESTEKSALDGVPDALPALLKAYRMTEKASALGFDWRRTKDVMEKLREEVAELDLALNGGDDDREARVREEMGDVLFVMANLCRKLGVEPETALQGANSRFKHRFTGMEQIARDDGVSLRGMSLEEQDELWDRVKAEEREGS
ncbi:MAG: nucleoside triphosphate pyrophosphohydrolase [bacterium]|nr:nucleoside triphosphate pyrophosphohydrolase [bacterium]